MREGRSWVRIVRTIARAAFVLAASLAAPTFSAAGAAPERSMPSYVIPNIVVAVMCAVVVAIPLKRFHRT